MAQKVHMEPWMSVHLLSGTTRLRCNHGGCGEDLLEHR